MAGLAQLFAMLVLAPAVPGVVVRTKSWWAGRRGAPVLQLVWDLLRLARKTPVYSATTTPVFRASPHVVLGSAVAASLVVPFAATPILMFPGDFLFLAYAWGLGRFAMMLGALDTGSPFQGMGASREATFSTLAEPIAILVVGTIGLVTGADTLTEVLRFRPHDPSGWLVWGVAVFALIVVVLVESSRMPIDDPTTHLELTMIHEVMILDHSGPDLAALQVASGLKLVTGLALLAALIAPFPDAGPGLVWGLHVVGIVGLAVALGTLESLTARLRMRAVPTWILLTVVACAAALFVATWNAAGVTP